MDMTEVKKVVDDTMSAFEEYKKTNDAAIAELKAKGTVSPELQAKLDKIEKSMAPGEEVNKKFTAADQAIKAEQDAREQAEKKAAARIDELEKRLNRPGTGGSPEEQRAELKQRVNVWLRGVHGALVKGEMNLPEPQRKAIEEARAEYKALDIADDTTGGYLAYPEYEREIIKAVTEVSPARMIARVRPTASKSVMVPKRTGQFAAVRTTEAGTRSETTGLTYGMVEVNAPEMYALVDISNHNLEDSAYDMEGEVTMEAVEQFAVLEGSEFVSGSGVDTIEGITSAAAAVATTNSGAATTVTADGMLSLKHAIKSDYARNATWIMNRTVMGSVRKLKDGAGNYLWMPGIAMGRPNTIDGDPYVEFPDMPNEGAGNKPIGYGDFRRAVTLADRIGMAMLRDPYTQATSGRVRFFFRRRVGGRVVLAEAIRLLTCAA